MSLGEKADRGGRWSSLGSTPFSITNANVQVPARSINDYRSYKCRPGVAHVLREIKTYHNGTSQEALPAGTQSLVPYYQPGIRMASLYDPQLR